jgi:hypothetical protein
VVESDSLPTVCPSFGIARISPSHSFLSRAIDDAHYISPGASLFSKQVRWIALDSMIGIPSQCFAQNESLGTFQSQVLPVIRERSLNEEASYTTL